MTAALYYKQEGIQQGIRQGILKGKEEGKREGKREGTFMVARNMLNAGSEPSFIEKVTGLSTAIIKGLKVA